MTIRDENPRPSNGSLDGPAANGGWVYTTLVSFNGDDGGGNPEGALIFDPAGNLYGTTSGSLAGYGSEYEGTP